MNESSTAEHPISPGASPIRLRAGVLLIIVWWIPFWALAPRITDSLSGLTNPPSVAAVTTTIVIVQTIIGLLGIWIAGTQVKSIIKGSTKRQALRAIWSIFLHGEIRGQVIDSPRSPSGDTRPPGR